MFSIRNIQLFLFPDFPLKVNREKSNIQQNLLLVESCLEIKFHPRKWLVKFWSKVESFEVSKSKAENLVAVKLDCAFSRFGVTPRHFRRRWRVDGGGEEKELLLPWLDSFKILYDLYFLVELAIRVLV